MSGGAPLYRLPRGGRDGAASLVSARRAKETGARSDTHGSARWATRVDLEAAGLLGRDAGVYIGAWSDGRTVHYLRHDGPQHVLAFAPARSGKGVGLVLPTLLSWPGSVVVHDIKGENWALTAGWRRRDLGSACLKFDPTAADGSSARYNPLLEVRPWPDDVKVLSLSRDPIVAQTAVACDFALTDLLGADRPVSLYLTTPPSDITRTRPLLRLLLNQLGRRLTETLDPGSGRLGSPPRSRLLLMLDEFPALGRLDFLQTALAYLPGYGIRAYLIVQDLAQLAQTNGRDESIVSNCHVRVAYTANKVETAKVISEMAGTMTVHREARTYTGNRLSPVLLHVMASEQEVRRPLLTPDEVMRLPDDTALIFVAGRAPIYGRRIRYYEDPVFTDRASIPPPIGSDRLTHDWGTWPEPTGPSHTGLAAVGTSDHSDEAAAAATPPSPSPAEEDDEWPPLSPPIEPRTESSGGGS